MTDRKKQAATALNSDRLLSRQLNSRPPCCCAGPPAHIPAPPTTPPPPPAEHDLGDSDDSDAGVGTGLPGPSLLGCSRLWFLLLP